MTNDSPDPNPDDGARLALLIELHGDRAGALEAALQPFARHGVRLTHIESRPRRGQTFDFYVDCEARRGDSAVAKVLVELRALAVDVATLHDRDVPWFPRHITELDRIANHTLDAGDADHPGFHDAAYRARRAQIERLAAATTTVRRYRRWSTAPRSKPSGGRSTSAWWPCMATRPVRSIVALLRR